MTVPRPTGPPMSYPLFGALLSGLAVIELAPGLLGPSLDGSVYALIGNRVAAGDIPYVDVWDHKPPGIYVVNALGDFLSGSAAPWQLAWAASVVAIVLTGVVVTGTLRGVVWRRSAWLAGALCAAALAAFPVARGGGLTETLAVLPATIAMRLAILGLPSGRRALLAGLLVGIGTAISLQALPALVAVASALVARKRATGIPSAVWGIACLAAGAGVVWVAALALLAMAGALPAAVIAIVRYNAAFGLLGVSDDPLLNEAVHGLLVLSPLVLGGLLGVRRSLASPQVRPLAVGAVVWIVGTIAFIAAQRRLELHYLALLTIPLSLLFPASLPRPIRAPRPEVLRAGLVASLLMVGVLVASTLIATETAIALDVRSRQAARAGTVAGWIASHSTARETLFIWGNQPHLYTKSRREPASRFIYILPLITPGFTSQHLISEVVDQWQREPPAVIVDAGSVSPGSPGMPELLIPRQTEVGDLRDLDLLDPLRDFVRERYALAITLEGWPIYVLR